MPSAGQSPAKNRCFVCPSARRHLRAEPEHFLILILRPLTVFKGHEKRYTRLFLRCHCPITNLSQRCVHCHSWMALHLARVSQTNKQKSAHVAPANRQRQTASLTSRVGQQLCERGEISGSGAAADAFRSAVRGVQTGRRWRRWRASLGRTAVLFQQGQLA